MKRAALVFSGIVSLSLFLLFIGRTASLSETVKAEKPQVIGMLFYADGCASCKVLEPKLKEVVREFQGQGILFTRFDLTDEFTKDQSALYAAWVDLDEVYRDNPKTGFMLLINPKTKNVLGTLAKNQSPEELRKNIQTALASVQKESQHKETP